MRTLGLTCFALLAACTGGVASTTGEDGTSADLVNAALDTGDPAVMRLDLDMANGDEGTCTATLVGSHTALTAAHCWRGMLGGGVLLADGTHLSVIRGAYPPEYSNVPIFGAAHDVGVLHLSAPIEGIEPSLLATSPPAVGDTITMVGFGEHDQAGDYDGLKRAGTNQIAGEIATLFWTSGTDTQHATLDHGDSGGPAYVVRNGRRVIAGVASQGAVAQDNFWGHFEPTMSLFAKPDHNADWLTQEIGRDLYDGVHWARPSATPPAATLSSLTLALADVPRANQPFVVNLSSDGEGAVRLDLWLDGDLWDIEHASLPLAVPTAQMQMGPAHHTLVVLVRDAQTNAVIKMQEIALDVMPR